jgi:hypothetical protein
MSTQTVHEIANPRTLLRRTTAWALTSMCAAVLCGCPSPDPEAKYDRYLDDTKEQRDEFQGMKQDVSGALADITGDFLLSLSSVIAPDLPLQFVVTVEFTDNGDGTATGNFSFQPLSLNPGSTTEPRMAVGPTLDFPGIPIDAGGGFSIDMGSVMVTGMANPITGSDIAANLVLTGAIQSADNWCGTVEGMVTSPLTADLAGSTFNAARVMATDPASLPGADGQPPLESVCPAGGGMGDTDGATDGGMGTGG